MIQLVLEESGQEFVGLDRHFITVEVIAREMDLLGAHDLERHSGYRKAALVVDPFVAGFDDHRIDECLWTLADVVDEESFLHADLRSGQAQTGLVVHRLQHVSGEKRQFAIDVLHLGGHRAEHWIAEHSDLVGGRHGHEGYRSRAVTQYFDAEPAVTSDEQTVALVLPDLRTDLVTDRGVFSADQVDTGSKILLIEGPPPTAGDKVLVDVGCGYGPIAYALAVRNPEAEVWAVDINQRARALCARNTASLGNVRVMAPDDVPDGVAVDRIWSNPPIRIGKKALHDLLNLWLPRLRTGGSAHLVVQKHLGADSLHRWMEQQGHTVQRRTSRKAYRILDVSK